MANFKINREKKTFVFDDGEEIPIPKNKVREVLRTPAARNLKSQTKKEIGEYRKKVPLNPIEAFAESAKESFLGNPFQTGLNYAKAGTKAFSPGEGQDELGYVDRVLDNFYALQEARQEEISEISQEYPKASGLGTGVGMIGELAALRKLPGSVAFPVMGAAHSDTSFLEPGEKTKELGKDALIGASLDKFFGSLNKVAGARQTRRNVEKSIQDVEKQNLQEIEQTRLANERNQGQFSADQAAREAEMGLLPGQQAAENARFAETSAERVNKIAKTIGNQPIDASALAVEDFVDQVINTSANAASKDANYVSKFLRTIFKGDQKGKITGEALKKGMAALDEAILVREGASKEMLGQYRSFVLGSLPQRISNSYIYEKWAPKFVNMAVKGAEKELVPFIQNVPEISRSLSQRLGENYLQKILSNVRNSVTSILGKYKGNFLEALESGSIKQEILEAIQADAEYQKVAKHVQGILPQVSNKGLSYQIIPGYQALEEAVLAYPRNIAEKSAKAMERYLPNVSIDSTKTARTSQRAVDQIHLQPSVVPAPAPISPPTSLQPNLQQVPVIPEARGLYEKLAYGLEGLSGKSVQQAAGSIKDSVPLGIFAKLAGLPVGKIAGTAAAAVSGTSALTSPGAVGGALRTGLNQGARAAYDIEEIARKYPSYHDGIIDDPQERRSLTKEIEDSPSISLEEKAIFQSKVNRGKPLNDRLQ